MARLFIGLEIPERVASRVGEEADRLRLSGAKVSWISPRLFHLTVRFLGEIADQELAEITNILKEEAAGTGTLKLVAKGLGWFPEGVERPRVIWCGVDGETADHTEVLVNLRRRLDRRLQDLGLRREKGRFFPHITLGRVRGPDNLDSLVERIGPTVRREFGHFQVSAVNLFESGMSQDGLVYTSLFTAQL